MEQSEQILKQLKEQGRRLGQVDTAIALVAQQNSEHEKTLEKIGLAISSIAEQNQKIVNIQDQLTILWKKNDELTNPETGSISKIKNDLSTVKTNLEAHVASCPRLQIDRIWWAIGILAIMQTGAFLTLLYKSFWHVIYM